MDTIHPLKRTIAAALLSGVAGPRHSCLLLGSVVTRTVCTSRDGDGAPAGASQNQCPPANPSKDRTKR